LQNLNLLRFFLIEFLRAFFFLHFALSETQKGLPRGGTAKEGRSGREFLWKFERNISFCFDSAILLSVKQIIIQKKKSGVKRRKKASEMKNPLEVFGKKILENTKVECTSFPIVIKLVFFEFERAAKANKTKKSFKWDKEN
jgi:hypothetical protein